MNRPKGQTTVTALITVATGIVALGWLSAAHATDPVTKCQEKKLKAQGKLQQCLQRCSAAATECANDATQQCSQACK